MSRKRKILAAGTKLAIVELYEKKKKQTEIASLLDLNTGLLFRELLAVTRSAVL